MAVRNAPRCSEQRKLGGFGGELCHVMLPCERPCMEWQADETCTECYDGQKKCFTDGNNHFTAPNGKCASHMYAGGVSEFGDPFWILYQSDVDRYKKWCITVNERRLEQGFPMLAFRPNDHLVTKLDDQVLPVLEEGKAVRTRDFPRGAGNWKE